MKKTLFIVLLLAASAITAQAQGFRVYRSDGTVYQFSWVADSIAFYDGEGDPSYVEPIPEEVRRAIEELQTYVANNAAMIQTVNDMAHANSAYIKDVAATLASVKTDVAYLNEATRNLASSISATTEKINDNAGRIATTETQVATIQDIITTLQEVITDLQGRVAAVNTDVAETRRVANNAWDLGKSALASANDANATATQALTMAQANAQDIRSLMNDIATLSSHVVANSAIINELRESDVEKQYKIEELQTVVTELLNRVAELENQNQ